MCDEIYCIFIIVCFEVEIEKYVVCIKVFDFNLKFYIK